MSFQDKITATNGGGQGNAFALTKEYNVVENVAKANDSVLLPVSSIGKRVWIFNTGANSLNIFPEKGGSIDGEVVNAAKALKADEMIILEGTAKANTWKSVV